ncbi:MAG: NAD(P)/FAD-dependent oxidoreductase [Actinomycetota bacterium]|nr:NAD(P)/FAD-dependent oxidoreductase [Actinomycetota bacterium]
MAGQAGREYVETLVIGGGQAGLATGYQLSQRDLPYKIIDANERIGDAWRNRWDSLRLFTPNRLNHLPGMPFPGYHWGFPSKNEMADYLASYARKFDLQIETGVRVERLSREGDRFVAISGDRTFEADNVVVAMSSWQRPRVPDFASELDPRIVQLHVAEYKNPEQLQEGDVLVVGAGNSGAEVAIEAARTHKVLLAGAGTGAIPFRPESVAARVLMPFIGRVIFHRVLTTGTPIGKKARPKWISTGEPLIRTKPKDLAAAGVERVPRVIGVEGGMPQLEDDRSVDVANVVWCTGFHPGFSWIDLPVLGPQEPLHRRGIVESEPGLYFIGLKFLYSVSSEQIQGVGRDAGYIAGKIAARRGVRRADRSAADPPKKREAQKI